MVLELDEVIEVDDKMVFVILEPLEVEVAEDDEDELELKYIELEEVVLDEELANKDELGVGGKKVVVGTTVDTTCSG